jgi:hypothetical protein
MPFLEKVVHGEEVRLEKAKKEKELEAPDSGEVAPPTRPVISIQDRMKERASEASGEIEDWLDEFCVDKSQSPKTVQEFSNLFKTMDIRGPHARFIRASFERRAEEIAAATEGRDKLLTEAYSNFSKAELKKLNQFHVNLLGACDMLQEAAKVTRAPKKKKPVSQDKLVAKVKYRKDDTALGLVSLPPVQMLGAKEIWLYNTKSRKLSHYRAMDNMVGITVKNSSLQEFSADSVEKTLRRPAEQLADFKKASKVKLRTFLQDIKAVDTNCNGRITEHHIILRIDK